MQEAFSKPHLGAFSAAPKTGLSGAPLFAPAPAPPWLNPSNPLRGARHPVRDDLDPGVEFCNAKLHTGYKHGVCALRKLQKQNRNAVLRPHPSNPLRGSRYPKG
jgi:hypothetical protein